MPSKSVILKVARARRGYNSIILSGTRASVRRVSDTVVERISMPLLVCIFIADLNASKHRCTPL